jgi:hypothetical protein
MGMAGVMLGKSQSILVPLNAVMYWVVSRNFPVRLLGTRSKVQNLNKPGHEPSWFVLYISVGWSVILQYFNLVDEQVLVLLPGFQKGRDIKAF